MCAIRAFLVLAFGVCLGAGTAVGQVSGTSDPASQAVALVERTLDQLRQSRDQYVFTDQFANASARHPCDVCPKVSLMGIAEYAFHVHQHFPDTFIFHHRIHWKQVHVERDQDGRPARVHVPFTKWLSESSVAKEAGYGPARRIFLIATVLVGATGEMAMETVLEEASQAQATTMLAGSMGMALGTPVFGDGSVLVPDYSAMRYGLGVERYFHPFGTPNRRNIWLKAGLRLQWAHVRLAQDQVSFAQSGLALTPATTPTTSLSQHIDLVWQVRDLEEQVRTIGILLPLGVSKWWALGEHTSLALDLEVVVGRELNNTVTGRYQMDQHGREHVIDGMVMRQSNGEPLVYVAAPAAVVLEDGERVDFFSERQFVLDELVARHRTTLALGLSPSIFIRNRKGAVYRAGLELSLTRQRADSDVPLDQTYFLADDDNSRPLLNTFTKKGIRPWLGLVFAIKL